MTEIIKKSDLLKAMARIQPSAENYGSDENSDRNASVEDSAYWAARDMFDDIMFQIQQVTDAKTEYAPVVHGYWKANRKLCMPECSVCEARPFRGYIPSMGEVEKTYKYCPNCGAKMDESEGEE